MLLQGIGIVAIFALISSTVFAARCDPAYLRQNTIAFFNFSDAALPLVDSLNYANQTAGTTRGAAAGIVDSGQDFELSSSDHTRQRNVYTKLQLASAMSLTGWIKRESTTTTMQTIVDYTGASWSRGWYCQIVRTSTAGRENNFGCTIYNGTGATETTEGIALNSTGVWYQVSMTYAGNDMSICVNRDCRTDYQQDLFDGNIAYSSGNHSLAFGDVWGGNAWNARYFDGILDDFAFFNVTLNSSCLDYMYNSGAPNANRQYDYGYNATVPASTPVVTLSYPTNGSNLGAAFNGSIVLASTMRVNCSINSSNWVLKSSNWTNLRFGNVSALKEKTWNLGFVCNATGNKWDNNSFSFGNIGIPTNTGNKTLNTKNSITWRFNTSEPTNYTYGIGASCVLWNVTNGSSSVYSQNKSISQANLRLNHTYYINTTIRDNSSNSKSYCIAISTWPYIAQVKSCYIQPMSAIYRNTSFLNARASANFFINATGSIFALWYRNSTLYSPIVFNTTSAVANHTNQTIYTWTTAGILRRGELLGVSCYANSGGYQSTYLNSSLWIVSNLLPQTSSPLIFARGVNDTNQNFEGNCSFTDQDYDAITPQWILYRNNTLYSNGSFHRTVVNNSYVNIVNITAAMTKPNETWRLSCRGIDTGNGTWVNSSLVKINNKLPLTVNSLVISPLTLRTNSTPKANISVAVADGNNWSVACSWFINGTNVSYVEPYNYSMQKNLTLATAPGRGSFIDPNYFYGSGDDSIVRVYNYNSPYKSAFNLTSASSNLYFAASDYYTYNKYIFAGGYNNRVDYYNKSTGAAIGNIPGMSDHVHYFWPSYKYLWVVSNDKKTYVFNATTFAAVKTITEATDLLKEVHSDNQFACVVGNDDVLRIYNESSPSLRNIANKTEATNNLYVCFVGQKYIYSGGTEQVLRLYNKSAAGFPYVTQFPMLSTPGDLIRGMVEVGDMVYMTSDSRKISVWNWRNLSFYHNISTGTVSTSLFADQNYIMTGGSDNTQVIWNIVSWYPNNVTMQPAKLKKTLHINDKVSVECRARTKDGVYQLSSATSNVTVLSASDITAPNISYIFPPNNTLLTSELVNFIFNVTDANLSRCDLYLNSVNSTNVTVNGSGQYNFSYETGLINGNHTWQIKCTDLVGNIGFSDIYTIVIDVPSTPIPTPTPGSPGGGGSNPTPTPSVVPSAVPSPAATPVVPMVTLPTITEIKDAVIEHATTVKDTVIDITRDFTDDITAARTQSQTGDYSLLINLGAIFVIILIIVLVLIKYGRVSK